MEANSHTFMFYIWIIQIAKNIFDFLTPSIVAQRPGENVSLPELDDEEFKPYNRALPEIDLWKWCMVNTIVIFVLSQFAFFDFPVYWPFMLGYVVIAVGVVLFNQFEQKKNLKYVFFPGLQKKIYN